MQHEEILSRLLPPGGVLRADQTAAIHRLLAGKNTLSLMPTGAGKSLIFQYAAARMDKTAVVLSPLRALMSQQNSLVEEAGFTSAALHDLGDYRAYHKALQRFAADGLASFLYMSPERSAADGFLSDVLRRNRHDIGLIVVDEAHCVSQWGDTFRPLYRLIPGFLSGIFDASDVPPILCLTATLNADDENDICASFGIPSIGKVRSEQLRRTNIALSFEVLHDQDAKEERLESILRAHSGEKVLVYAHIVANREYGTRALADKFKAKGFACDYFDAQASEEHKLSVFDRFVSGELPIIFATSAFGMGIHIPDIRAVVHYLIPESVEQYYQEVGRAGRDGSPAKAYLFYTNTNLKVRRHLLQKSLPSPERVAEVYEQHFAPQGSGDFASYDPFRDNSEYSHELAVFVALLDAGVIQRAGAGVDNLRCFAPAPGVHSPAWGRYGQSSRTGSVVMSARKTAQSPMKVVDDLWSDFVDGRLKLANAPNKVIFYRHGANFEEQRDRITGVFEERRAKRQANFEKFVSIIESNDPEGGVYEALSI
jgi:ATP-dependent DNA helicase RecQ